MLPLGGNQSTGKFIVQTAEVYFKLIAIYVCVQLNRPCVVGVGAASGWTIQPISPSRMSSGVFDAVGHLIIQEGKRITMGMHGTDLYSIL